MYHEQQFKAMARVNYRIILIYLFLLEALSTVVRRSL